MKIVKFILPAILASTLLISGCSSLTKTQKGAGIGTAAGGAAGAIIGRASGNTAMGTIIGAAVGGVSGAIIGRKMDQPTLSVRKRLAAADQTPAERPPLLARSTPESTALISAQPADRLACRARRSAGSRSS